MFYCKKHLEDKYENSSQGKRASVHMAMDQFRAISPPARLTQPKKKEAILKISMKIVNSRICNVKYI